MSRVYVLELLYAMVEDMTVANGFYYNWNTRKGGEIFRNDRTAPSITISLGDETDVTDRGGVGSAEYMSDVVVEMLASVPMGGIDTKGSDVHYEQQEAISKALNDIVTRYDCPTYLCAGGGDSSKKVKTKELRYLGNSIDEASREGKFTTMRMTCQFNIKYVTQRKLGDIKGVY